MPFGRSYGRFRAPFKRAVRTVNHYELVNGTAAGTEETNTIFTGTDTSTNRTTHIPGGSVLRRVLVRMWGTDATPVAGKHQCILLLRKGGEAYTTTQPIGAWYLGTDPLTEDAISIRREILGRPHTIVTITGASGPPRMTCFWRGSRRIEDGDDIVLAQLDDGTTQWTMECEAAFDR